MTSIGTLYIPMYHFKRWSEGSSEISYRLWCPESGNKVLKKITALKKVLKKGDALFKVLTKVLMKLKKRNSVKKSTQKSSSKLKVLKKVF